MTFRGRRRRGIWWAAGAVVIAGAAVILVLSQGKGETTPPALATVKRGNVTSSVAAAGTIQPVSTRELSFAVAGTLKTVSVKAGDQVTAGQVLAALDPADAADAVADAQSTYNEAEQQLSEAQAALTACLSPAPTPSATSGPGPQRTQSSQGSQSSQSSQGSQPQQCRDDIYSSQTAANNAKSALAKAKRNLSGTTITAPVAGKVLSVGGKAGDQAGTGTFITLGVVETMLVKAAFAEADVAGLAVGQKATVVLADRKEQIFDATITQVDATATTSGQLVRYTVLIALDKAPDNLLIGQSATANVVFRHSDNVLYLPQSAVKSSGEVRLPDGKSVQVGVGLRGDGLVEITSGLSEGSQVLLSWRG